MITQTADELKVTRRTASGGREAIMNSSYKLNGTESLNQIGPLVFRTTAQWENGALILTSTVTTEENPIGTMRQIYSLDHGQLVVESSRSSPAGLMNDRTVHEKVVRSPQ